MTDTVFWAAVQGVGTLVAAVAAVIALLIAASQLRLLIASNRLLAESNDTMAESNIALTRPYVVVDYEFRPSALRGGGTGGTSVFVTVRNDGKTPAHNVTMRADRPFAPISTPTSEGWRKSIADLNRMANGTSVLRSLTATRPLTFYLDNQALFGSGDEAAPSWSVAVTYEDTDGRRFEESFHLDVEPWRRSLAVADPLVRVGKYVDAVAHEISDLERTIRRKQSIVNVTPRVSPVFTGRPRRTWEHRRVLRGRHDGFQSS